MGLILTYEVICRYLLGDPTIWAQETAIYIFMWTMLAGAAYTLMQGKHVRLDIIVALLPKRGQLMLDAITCMMGATFCALVTWQSLQMLQSTIRFGRVSPTLLRIPMWIPQSALLLGFSLLTLQFMFIVFDKLAGLKEGGEAQ
jgi:TRAP-type C4-dicarboxylate transport system permease small subunit